MTLAPRAWPCPRLALASPRRPAALPKVPEGFEIRLVAAVPAVQFPCQVATAPDGSLFVAEDPMDQVGPANKPIDRILVFRDGKDPVVFAEKLNAVFGMVWHDGALYVMNMPNLTVLRDTDGDGKADQRKELFTDLGVPAGQPNMFNDHIVSGLQFGIDGYLYISVGDKGVPKATGPDGRTAQVFGGGTLRCRLDGTGLEVFTHRHPQPPRAEPRRPRQPVHLRQHRRRPRLVDPGHAPHRRRLLRLPLGLPRPHRPDARPDGRVRRRLPLRRARLQGRRLAREVPRPRLLGRVGQAERPRLRASSPRGRRFKVADVEDFIQPGDVGDFRPLDLALSYDGKTMYVADWGMGGWGNKTEKLGRVYAVTYTGEIKTRPRGKDSDPIDAQIKALVAPVVQRAVPGADGARSRQGKAALGARRSRRAGRPEDRPRGQAAPGLGRRRDRRRHGPRRPARWSPP